MELAGITYTVSLVFVGVLLLVEKGLGCSKSKQKDSVTFLTRCLTMYLKVE